MSSCGDGSEKPRKECSKTAEKAREECVEERDLGYNNCVQTRTDRQKQCCDWAPCSWFCDAFWWLVSVVCIAWEWISNVSCVAWHTIKEVVCIAWIIFPVLVCYLVDAVASVVAAVVSVIEAALNWAWSIVGFIVDILLSVPGIGRGLSWLFNAAKAIVNLIISTPDALLTLFGIMPEKKLRLGIIVLRDWQNNPVVHDEGVLLRAVQCIINIYREQLNVRVIPIRYAQYQTAYDSEEVASRDYLFYDDGSSPDRLLDLCCEACAFGEDLGTVGSQFNLIMSRHTFWGNGRRLLGYGAPVVAFTARRYTTVNSGCSLGPLSDWVTVQFQDSQSAIPAAQLDSSIPLGSISTLAHEVTHACNIIWHESGNDNLMSRLRNGDRMCVLTRAQKVLIRASRHITYV